jgi:ribonuclease R
MKFQKGRGRRGKPDHASPRPESSAASNRPHPDKHRKPSPPPARPRPAPGGGRTTEGVLDRKGRVGFVLSEQPGETDVLVQGASLRLAMAGDRVRVRLEPTAAGQRRQGEIVEVVAHARQTFVGLFGRAHGEVSLVSEEDDTRLAILDLQGLNPHEGDVAVARITRWPTKDKPAAGVLIELIGPREAPGADLKILIRKHELPDAFPPAAQAEAAAYGEEVPPDAWKDRRTLFDLRVFTIDGADAKDFDDAVSIEPLDGGGWRLGVHIADVSHYVRAGSALDEEAFHRGTSVYLTGSVLPMLPFSLSDNLCSLRPDLPRLTLSCEMDIGPDGRVIDHRVFESVIRSARRFTYEEVETLLNGGAVDNVTPDITRDVREMGRLAKLVRGRRIGRGSLDFDFPEPYIITDVRGRPIDIRKRARLEAHRLIEDFMILANETVAEHMRAFPFLYRVHEKPDLQKMERLQKTLNAVGVPVPPALASGKPSVLQKLLKSVEGRPVQSIVQTMSLRSLKQAVYSEVNAGHFGLGSTCYTHFTSPIRRYPDLIVHRLLRERIHNQLTLDRQHWWSRELPRIARECSHRERVAVDAEREFISVQRVRFMEHRIGEEFDGVVTGVASFGFFVQLNEAFVEGLVRVADLDDYYIFHEDRLTLVGKRSGKAFRLGTPVRVKLVGADALKGQIDFKLLTSPRR